MTLIFIDQSCINILINYIISDCKLSKDTTAVSMMAYPFGLAMFLLLCGQVIDKTGWKKVFLFGGFLFSIGSLLCGLSINSIMIIFARYTQGAGAGCLITFVLVIINLEFPVKIRGKLFGACIGIAAIGFSLAPILASIIAHYISWRLIFLINTIICMVVVQLVRKYKAKVIASNQNSIDFYGFIIYVLILIITVISSFYKNLSLYLLIIVCCIWLFFVEKKSRNPLIPLRFFKNINFSIGNVILFSVQLNIIFVFFWALFIQNLFHIPPLYLGFVMLPCFLPALILSKFAGVWYDKKGAFKPLWFASISLLTGSIFTLIGISTQMHWFFYFGITFYGIGTAIFIPVINIAILTNVKKTDTGKASAILQMMRQRSMTMGTLSFSKIILKTDGLIDMGGLVIAHEMLLIINICISVIVLLNYNSYARFRLKALIRVLFN